jgi:hypothetical protein
MRADLACDVRVESSDPAANDDRRDQRGAFRFGNCRTSGEGLSLEPTAVLRLHNVTAEPGLQVAPKGAKA